MVMPEWLIQYMEVKAIGNLIGFAFAMLLVLAIGACLVLDWVKSAFWRWVRKRNGHS